MDNILLILKMMSIVLLLILIGFYIYQIIRYMVYIIIDNIDYRKEYKTVNSIMNSQYYHKLKQAHQKGLIDLSKKDQRKMNKFLKKEFKSL